MADYGMLDTRYAIYFAPPPGSPLKQFGDAWLGRDPDRDERVPQPVVHDIPSERLHEITALPRGWHEVEGNGYVCRGEGFQLGTTPQTFEPSPVPPSATAPSPPIVAAPVDDTPAAVGWVEDPFDLAIIQAPPAAVTKIGAGQFSSRNFLSRSSPLRSGIFSSMKMQAGICERNCESSAAPSAKQTTS